jgi:putative transposase
LFLCRRGHLAYQEWLAEACTATGCLLHAYVLMTNHVHLLLTPPESESVSRLMISLGRRYVQYINKTYRRTGTLWDSRYKSSLIQVDAYLLLCQRYIELNPVRAAMVDDPAHYRWSSYRKNGLGQDDRLLTPHAVYSGLGANEADRLANYRVLFRPELNADAIGDMRMALDQGQPLGDARFIDSIERATGQRREIRRRGRPRKAMPEEPGPQNQLLLIIC